MNGSHPNQGCLKLLPLLPIKQETVNDLSWQWSQHALHHYSECVSVETFIKRTVPCPPPWNPCIFWSVINKANLTQSDLDSVQETCGIPNHYDCNVLSLAVKPETDSCNITCIALISVLICLFLLIIIAIVLWSLRKKGNLPEICNGVCVCCDKVFIRKNGLNRTESRSPTLATENGKTDKRHKESLEDGIDNECISLDLKNGTADYFLKSLEKGNGIMGDDGDYETLRENKTLGRNSYPAPDVTMVTRDDNDRHHHNRSSYC